MPTLLLHYPEKKRRWKVEVEGERFVIGRSRESEICIPHSSVSKRHVLIERRRGQYVYSDLGSKNGIYLNEFRKDRGSLEDGDELRVGSIRVTFYGEKAPESPPLEASPPPCDEPEAPPIAREIDDPAFDGKDTLSVVSVEPGGAPEPRSSAPVRRVRRLEPVRRARASPAVEREAREPVPGPRRWPRRRVALAAAGCVALGLLIGYAGMLLDRRGDEAVPAGSAESPSAAGQGVVPVPVQPQTASSGLSAPLGPPAPLDEPETALRLVTRLHIDLLGRSPLREELRALQGLSHEKIWDRIISRAAPLPEPPPEETSTLFERFLARKPSPAEQEWALSSSRGDAAHYAFQVATSSAYAAREHRRQRTSEQLARCLFVDLKGSEPSLEDEKMIIAAVNAARGDVGPVATVLLESPGSAGGPGGPDDAAPWVRDAYARLLLRFPSREEEAKALGALRPGGAGWQAVLRDLTGRKEYLSY